MDNDSVPFDPEEIITIDDDDDEIQTTNQIKEAGKAYFSLKKYDQAIECYSSVINFAPDKLSTALFYVNRASCLINLGKYAEALEDSVKSVTLDPTYLKGYSKIIKCRAALGDIAGARSTIEHAKVMCAGDKGFQDEVQSFTVIEKHREDAARAYEKGDFRRVVFIMDTLINMGISPPVFRLLKAECLAYIGRYQEAQEFANSILMFDKQNAEAIFIRGLVLYYEDNVDLAISHFQRALKLAPEQENVKKAYRKARALKQKKEDGNAAFNASRLDEAYALYTEALAVDNANSAANAKLYFNRATVCSKLNRLPEAITNCTSALTLDPKYLKALLRRAKCYMDSAEYDKAIADYEVALKMDGSRENRRLLQEAKIEQKKSLRKDYYKILGVTKGASIDEIKKAYRKRALVHHPDRHTNATESERQAQERQFKEVGEAYGILSDPKKRARYDGGEDLLEQGSCPDFSSPFFFPGQGYTFHFS